MLLAICPAVAAAESGAEPMAALDLQFDAKQVVETARLRKQIANLIRAEAAQARAKSRNKAERAEIRNKLEDARNALADLAVDYVAQMEMAEALVRLDYGQALADRYKKDITDTLWRLDRRSNAGDARASATLGSLYRLGIVAAQNNVGQMHETGRARRRTTAKSSPGTSAQPRRASGAPRSTWRDRISKVAEPPRTGLPQYFGWSRRRSRVSRKQGSCWSG